MDSVSHPQIRLGGKILTLQVASRGGNMYRSFREGKISISFPAIIKVCLSLVIGFLLLPNFAYCQEPSLNKIVALSIEELANLDVSTPTKSSQKLSQTPATVRVITAKEIEERGYFTLEEAPARVDSGNRSPI